MPRKPNFIVIMADDLGYGDIGCDGGTLIRTPQLDRMAAEGARLTDFYASANVCTPSRAGLLTGGYAIRHGLAREVIQPADTNGLPPEAPTIPRLLKPDYATALIGKWHLGHVSPHWPPQRFGFDRFMGLAYSHDMRPLTLFDGVGEAEMSESKADFAKLTEHFFDETTAFVEAHKDEPFFILLALTAPHVPLRPNPDDPMGSPAGDYGEVVEEVDAQVGRLLRKLEALGLAEDTLVVFTSDNGPWFEGSSGPYRDRKGGAAWEGGYRVPFIAWKPGTIPAGTVSDALASNLDLLPTIAAMAGVEAPAEGIDGADLSGVLTRGESSPHDQVILFDNLHVAAVRTPRWKYVARSYYRTMDIPLDQHRYPLLFDMTTDPGETYSLVSRHPEVAEDMARRVAEARAKYAPFAEAKPPAKAPESAETWKD
ncbi:MAG: sulfatase [Phenylobacterium sp.]|uniref:sulfatase family protein n=1 Tax=Phenylobacterium sp. TaxID=1871053 RepID=UPI0025F9DC3B|nr:sulfatase [Phenylobacterium sp.]MCG9917032.1 sulfatase [Phenylobacterium sp.]